MQMLTCSTHIPSHPEMMQTCFGQRWANQLVERQSILASVRCQVITSLLLQDVGKASTCLPVKCFASSPGVTDRGLVALQSKQGCRSILGSAAGEQLLAPSSQHHELDSSGFWVRNLAVLDWIALLDFHVHALLKTQSCVSLAGGLFSNLPSVRAEVVLFSVRHTYECQPLAEGQSGCRRVCVYMCVPFLGRLSDRCSCSHLI